MGGGAGVASGAPARLAPRERLVCVAAVSGIPPHTCFLCASSVAGGIVSRVREPSYVLIPCVTSYSLGRHYYS